MYIHFYCYNIVSHYRRVYKGLLKLLSVSKNTRVISQLSTRVISQLSRDVALGKNLGNQKGIFTVQQL